MLTSHAHCLFALTPTSMYVFETTSLTFSCLMLQVKTEGGKIIRVEAHPIPEHPRPRRVKGRAALVGDAAGYVTKCSGEGIYFAAKSGRMAAEAIAEASQQVGLEAGCQTVLALLQSLPAQDCGKAGGAAALSAYSQRHWFGIATSATAPPCIDFLVPDAVATRQACTQSV